MIEFDQYLGFLAFLTILTIGFWLMIFLATFVIPREFQRGKETSTNPIASIFAWTRGLELTT